MSEPVGVVTELGEHAAGEDDAQAGQAGQQLGVGVSLEVLCEGVLEPGDGEVGRLQAGDDRGHGLTHRLLHRRRLTQRGGGEHLTQGSRLG